ncbi:MAG: hypothetical protein HDT39_00740 [Lachnospiraceae bacterium]|nr:hypothetical protein [Lachnospiraceae bacterium]
MGRFRKGAGIILILSIILIIAAGVYFFKVYDKVKKIPLKPEFSVESGMYDTDMELILSAEEGMDIYYTTDGSEPNSESTKYTEPVKLTNASGQKNKLSDMGPDLITGNSKYSVPVMNIDKGTVIRAIAMDSSGKSSEVATKTYFVGINNARYNNLPILSIVTNPYNLFDYYDGIYILGRTFEDYMQQNPKEPFNGSIPANYNRRGMSWERKSYMEYFDSTGNVKVSQDIGIRVQGAYSRANIQKSFSLYAREEYGKATIDYDFFNDSEKTSYSKLVIQNIEETKYIDPYVSLAAQNLDLDTVSSYQPVIVFIDGEYWGIYTLRPSVSVDYIADKYELDSDDVLLVKADGYGEYKIESGRARDIGYFNKLLTYAATHDMSVDKYYDKICEMMDINSFTDWICAEIYLGNNDCIKPGRPDNNVKVWRVMVPDASNPYADGKWRWILYDTDKAVGYQNDYMFDDVSKRLLEYNELSEMQKLFLNLIVNDEYRQLFINTFTSMGTTVFNQNVQEVKWEDFSRTYTSMLDRYYARFPSSEPDLQKSLLRVESIKEFFYNRPNYVTGMMDELNRYLGK